MPEEYTGVWSMRAPVNDRGIEPISPYPRVEPQKQKSDDRRRNERERMAKKPRMRRRFIAMRRLIAQMKNNAFFRRVNYDSAESEMREAGVQVAEQKLRHLLTRLRIPLSGNDPQFQIWCSNPSQSTFIVGKPLIASNRLILPESSEGLFEYNLQLQPYNLPEHLKIPQISAALETKGQFIHEQERLRLSFRQKKSGQPGLEMTISILVAAIEIDDGSRRVIIYQRPDLSYGLYADKQIDLSI